MFVCINLRCMIYPFQEFKWEWLSIIYTKYISIERSLEEIKRARVRYWEHHDFLNSSLNWLFLLSEPEGVEWDSSDLDNSESDTWQITDGMTRSTETSNKHFIVLINETHTTILWHEGSDSLVVFLELHSHTLSDGRVGLLSFDGDLFNDDTCCVRWSCEWLSPFWLWVRLVVLLISPPI